MRASEPCDLSGPRALMITDENGAVIVPRIGFRPDPEPEPEPVVPPVVVAAAPAPEKKNWWKPW